MRRFFIPLVVLLLSIPCFSAAGIAGAWLFVMDTEGGDRQVSAEFRLDGDSVGGKWSGTEVKGTFKDGKLDLKFPFESTEGGMKAELKISGQLDGEVLTGRWEFGEHSGTYKAWRK